MARDRSVGAFEQPMGLRPGDHACWWFEDRSRFLSDVVAFVQEGAQAGEWLCYAADVPAGQLPSDLADLPRRDALIERGQLVLCTGAEFFGDMRRFDPGRRLRDYRREIAATVGTGWPAARYAVDVTALAVAIPGSELAAYELALDGLVAGAPAVVLCGYDARRAPSGRAVEAVHPVQHPPEPPLEFSLHWAGADGQVLRLTGDVDVDTAEDLSGVLESARAATAGPFRLDLAGLRFMDAAATRVLAQHALALQVEGRGVELLSPRPAVGYCLEAFDLERLVRPAAGA